MNLEPIIQSEVSQKKKYKYLILMYAYGIQKDATDELVFRAAMKKHTSRADLWLWGEGEMYGESNMENRQPMGICYMTQATQTGAL